MARILLIGVNGQIGWELQRSLMTLGAVIPTSRQPDPATLAMDLANPDNIREVIREVQPHLIVNAAGYTAVDKAETEVELAMAANAIAPGVIAEEAKRCGAGVIHYSTDYIFDGTKTTPYTETDQPNPLNLYGQSKLLGEQAIQAIGVPHLILRTSWVYGLRGKNFLLTMLKLAQEREELKVVDDQIGAPTWSRTIAEATAQILVQTRSATGQYLTQNGGTYHLASTGQTSWYQFAKTIFDLSEPPQKLRSLIPIASAEYPSPVIRPKFSTLDLSKLSQTFQLNLPNWNQALSIALQERN